MNGVIADVNFQGHLARLMFILLSPEWRKAWDDLELSVHTFRELGVDPQTRDRAVYELCQARGLILITGNRNDDGPDSLEATIRDAGADALPVITLGNAQRVLTDNEFATDVALGLLEYLIDMRKDLSAFLGTGRQYLPKA